MTTILQKGRNMTAKNEKQPAESQWVVDRKSQYEKHVHTIPVCVSYMGKRESGNVVCAIMKIGTTTTARPWNVYVNGRLVSFEITEPEAIASALRAGALAARALRIEIKEGIKDGLKEKGPANPEANPHG